MSTNRNLKNKNMPSLPSPGELLNAIDAGDVTLAQALLDAGVDPNASDRGDTPLLLAISQGAEGFAFVKMLVDKGALLNTTDDKWQTPLIHAAAHMPADIATIEYLIEKGADLTSKDYDEFDALVWAKMVGNVQAAEVIAKALQSVQKKAAQEATIAAFHQTACDRQEKLKRHRVWPKFKRPSS